MFKKKREIRWFGESKGNPAERCSRRRRRSDGLVRAKAILQRDVQEEEEGQMVW